MARKNGRKDKNSRKILEALPDHTKRSILIVLLFIIGSFLTLAAFGTAGLVGDETYAFFTNLLGIGYFLFPALLFMLAGSAIRKEGVGFTPIKIVASIFFIAAGLGFVALVSGKGGLVGQLIADPLVGYLDLYVSLIVLGGLSLISFLIILEGGISFEPLLKLARALRTLVWRPKSATDDMEPELSGLAIDDEAQGGDEEADGQYEKTDEPLVRSPLKAVPNTAAIEAKHAAENLKSLLGQYTPPPLNLLERDKGRPGVGDIKGNANIIKRTLANFGIVVELDEISIGPSVTRYAIKPAEGVRLSKIVALQQNLALALAAKGGIRIEAPIPGKSLVGIEVPNSAKVTVGLGTLLDSPEYKDAPKPLFVALGRDIAGGSVFANIAKMPHALIAGATGSGKSVAIHTIINSLLYRCGPSQLRFIMIDPKRVELTLYRNLPHLLTPVITDAKKAIIALRWATKEMERRYNILEEKRVRDIESYHQNILTPALEKLRANGGPEEGEQVPEALPYIVVIIDELADIMQTFPRELEAAIVRLAQMSRAIGIHLLLSTQRPSVNVITGLIKANVPARVALQVASQIDSRTILDQGGAETLLGAGDMLYLSADMNKPVRLQSAFITEGEVKKIVDFISQNNEDEVPIDIGIPSANEAASSSARAGGNDFGDTDGEEEEIIEQARKIVIETGKASTSFLQRRMGLGYARAARILDALEARGVVGPGVGSKPRDILERGGGTPTQAPEESEV